MQQLHTIKLPISGRWACHGGQQNHYGIYRDNGFQWACTIRQYRRALPGNVAPTHPLYILHRFPDRIPDRDCPNCLAELNNG